MFLTSIVVFSTFNVAISFTPVYALNVVTYSQDNNCNGLEHQYKTPFNNKQVLINIPSLPVINIWFHSVTSSFWLGSQCTHTSLHWLLWWTSVALLIRYKAFKTQTHHALTHTHKCLSPNSSLIGMVASLVLWWNFTICNSCWLRSFENGASKLQCNNFPLWKLC